MPGLLGDVGQAAPLPEQQRDERPPSVGSLALAFLLAGVIGHALWLRLLVFFGTLVVCIVVLRFVFRQPIERLIGYQEYDDA